MERDEEEYEAKVKGIADIQASLPIGVTPAIMTRYEKKVQEIKDSAEDRRPVIKTLFWNRVAETTSRIPESPQPMTPLSSQHQPMTPLSSRRAGSEFSFGLNTPQSMAQSMNLNTPQSMVSRDDSSYDLDSSTDSISELNTR